MKRIKPVWLGPFCLYLLSALLAAPSAEGQDAKLQINHLDKLAAKAEETVDVTIDGPMLQLATKFLSSKKPDEAKAKELVAGLKGIYVKSFEFDKEGAYSDEDVSAIRAQIRAPAWSRIVGVRSKRERENVEVFTRMEGDKIIGLAIISAEPKELTIVNIVGPIDLDKLSDLEGEFGIPRMGLERSSKSEKE